MIPKEFVAFETAKLLKQAGFPQDGCEKIYSVPTGKNRNGYFGREAVCEYIPKPTQAQAMRWLREEKEMFIHILCNDAYGDNFCSYNWQLVKMMPFMDRDFNCEYDDEVISAVLRDPDKEYREMGLNPYKSRSYSYEEAAEAGIQAACKYLIEKGGVR